MPGLLVTAPELIRSTTIRDLEKQFPRLTKDQIRTQLIQHAYEYDRSLRHSMEECGMRLHCEQGIDGQHFIIEIVDDEVRQKFNFKHFYVYRGTRFTRGKHEAIGFDTYKQASAQYDADWHVLANRI